MASDQFRQLPLLYRHHKVKAGLHCTDETHNKADTYVSSYLAPFSDPETLDSRLTEKPRSVKITLGSLEESYLFLDQRKKLYLTMPVYFIRQSNSGAERLKYRALKEELQLGSQAK